eukprot:m.63068 g.63068  ORF g.63068 m.63068 type:complete len:461 (+) comp7434_c0_seq2:146-1528(+)
MAARSPRHAAPHNDDPPQRTAAPPSRSRSGFLRSIGSTLRLRLRAANPPTITHLPGPPALPETRVKLAVPDIGDPEHDADDENSELQLRTTSIESDPFISRDGYYREITELNAGTFDLINVVKSISDEQTRSTGIAHSLTALRDTNSNVVQLFDTDLLVQWTQAHHSHVVTREPLSPHLSARIAWKKHCIDFFPDVTWSHASEQTFRRDAVNAWLTCTSPTHNYDAVDCQCQAARAFIQTGDLEQLGFISQDLVPQLAHQIVMRAGGHAWLLRQSTSSGNLALPNARIVTISRVSSTGQPRSYRIIEIKGYGCATLDPAYANFEPSTLKTVHDFIQHNLLYKYSPCLIDACYNIVGRERGQPWLLTAADVQTLATHDPLAVRSLSDIVDLVAMRKVRLSSRRRESLATRSEVGCELATGAAALVAAQANPVKEKWFDWRALLCALVAFFVLLAFLPSVSP